MSKTTKRKIDMIIDDRLPKSFEIGARKFRIKYLSNMHQNRVINTEPELGVITVATAFGNECRDTLTISESM